MQTAMECGGEGGGGGASSSDGRQAARAMGVDVDELEVRVASETSDRLAEQADGPVRIKKKKTKLTKRGKGKSHDERRQEVQKERNDGAPRGAAGKGRAT